MSPARSTPSSRPWRTGRLAPARLERADGWIGRYRSRWQQRFEGLRDDLGRAQDA